MDTGLLRKEGLLTLPEGQVLRLRDAAGRHLTVVHGDVWITQLSEPRDPVLGAGETFRFERDGLSLVQPLGGPAVVLLEAGLVPEDDVPARESVSARARWLIHSESFQREAHRLRAEAIAAMFAAAARRMNAVAAALWSGLQRLARASARPAALQWLSDHQLRDLGLRRDQVRFTGLARPCAYC